MTPSETVCFQDMGCVSIRKLNSGDGGREEESRAKVPGEDWKGDAVGKDTYCQTRKLEFPSSQETQMVEGENQLLCVAL